MGSKSKPKQPDALPPLPVAPLLPLNQPVSGSNPNVRRRAGVALTGTPGLGAAQGSYKTALGS